MPGSRPCLGGASGSSSRALGPGRQERLARRSPQCRADPGDAPRAALLRASSQGPGTRRCRDVRGGHTAGRVPKAGPVPTSHPSPKDWPSSAPWAQPPRFVCEHRTAPGPAPPWGTSLSAPPCPTTLLPLQRGTQPGPSRRLPGRQAPEGLPRPAPGTVPLLPTPTAAGGSGDVGPGSGAAEAPDLGAGAPIWQREDVGGGVGCLGVSRHRGREAQRSHSSHCRSRSCSASAARPPALHLA